MVALEKILWHQQKVAAYLAGERIFPVTLELGITTVCNRACTDCPSQMGPRELFLPLALVERLFTFLRGRTLGLIVTGGEPTLHPQFAQILAGARAHGFVDVVVISNGSRLDSAAVWRPLLEHASALRISLYDWQESDLCGLQPTLQRIEALRQRVDSSASPLQIGVSVLSRNSDPGTLERIAMLACNAGAHWLYYHPTCLRRGVGAAERQPGCAFPSPQYQVIGKSDFFIYYIPERFSGQPLSFQGYHCAHFVLVVAADGRNYLASEAKFQPSYELANLMLPWDDHWLWRPERLAKITAVNANDYLPGGSRNRGVLYSHLIDTLKKSGQTNVPPPDYLLPHII